MKTADKINAKIAVIVGDDELTQGVATLRNLDSGEQKTVSFCDIIPTIQHILGQ